MEILVFSVKIIIILLLFTLSFLLGNLFPLAKRRNYSIIDCNQNIVIKNKKLKIKDIINDYKPLILQKKNLRGPKPSNLFYEVIDNNKDYLSIIYRVVWPDEIHPNVILNFIYKIFRIFYFGSKKDIEIILIHVNKLTGNIVELKYESDSTMDPDVFKSDHRLVSFNKSDLESLEIKAQILIPVLTWNHVFDSKLRKEKSENILLGYDLYNLPVYSLTNKLYKKFRFDRRSWIEYGSKINKKLPIIVGICVGIINCLLSSFILF